MQDVTSDLQTSRPKVIPLVFTGTGAWEDKDRHDYMMDVVKMVATRQRSKDTMKKKHFLSEIAAVITGQMGIMFGDSQSPQLGAEAPAETEETPVYTG